MTLDVTYLENELARLRAILDAPVFWPHDHLLDLLHQLQEERDCADALAAELDRLAPPTTERQARAVLALYRHLIEQRRPIPMNHEPHPYGRGLRDCTDPTHNHPKGPKT